MLGFIIMTLIFVGVIVGVSKMVDIEEVKKNWNKYRCRPDVMLMAGLYGHNAGDNLQFCLKNGFDEQAQQLIGPFYVYLKQFVDILMTLLKSINSIRMIFATIIGSVTQVFSEFSMRIQALFYRIQYSATRLKFLMGRVFAAMYAVIFMGMAGIKATSNFSNTFLFKFLDTFCFDPDTPVIIKGRGRIPIKSVEIGDEFPGGEKVSATFQFMADGQEMVRLGNVLVSTNHFLLHKGKWIPAEDHPDAIEAPAWSGGAERPLICLNTSTNSFPVGPYTFRDYDETSEGDKEAMEFTLKILNGFKKETKITNSTMATSSKIRTSRGLVPASLIKLGDSLTQGKVLGCVQKLSEEFVLINGEEFAPGTAIWNEEQNTWLRAGDFPLTQVRKFKEPTLMYSFIVSPSCCIETESGLIMRDYMEVHSPDVNTPYSASLANTEC
jgi:hypothetical protein